MPGKVVTAVLGFYFVTSMLPRRSNAHSTLSPFTTRYTVLDSIVTTLVVVIVWDSVKKLNNSCGLDVWSSNHFSSTFLNWCQTADVLVIDELDRGLTVRRALVECWSREAVAFGGCVRSCERTWRPRADARQGQRKRGSSFDAPSARVTPPGKGIAVKWPG